MNEQRKPNIGIKGLIVAGLTLALLIPTFLINNLVRERETRQGEAFKEISSKWAETQTIAGPLVSVPYIEYFKDTSGTVKKFRKFIHILPDQLNIDGNISPEKRSRGIFETVVYKSSLTFKGSFSNLLHATAEIPRENILFDQAFISVGITDLRGIEENVQLKWNGAPYLFNSGVETTDILEIGINSPVKINTSDTGNDVVDFSFNLNLNGSQFLYFTPVGKETNVNINSNWKTPSFSGSFLPDKRTITESGFKANWKVLHLNRNYPQTWLNSAYSVNSSSFGINLILPIDNYTKADRSIKYAILIIGLTFLIFFFLELINNKSVHPLQYILIGFALCIFYILLLSISEHLNYNISYLIASIMTIGLIAWYSISILKDKKLAALIAGNLIILYGFIFCLIQLEDFALLMGSIGLFIILALVMFFSKKIDWAGFSNRQNTNTNDLKKGAD